MKKYTGVLGAVCAIFLVLGLGGCHNYSDQIEELKKQNEELSAKLEELEAELDAEQAQDDFENFKAKSAAYAKFLADNSAVKLDKEYSNNGYYGLETFVITKEGKAVYSTNGEVQWTGELLGAEIPLGYKGIILYTKYDNHVNYGAECYPDYDEDKWEGSVVDDMENYDAITHHGCYSAFYITDEDDNTGTKLTMASGVWHPAGEPNGYTTCAKKVSEVKKLFSICGYSSTCGAYSTSFTLAD